MLIRNKRIRSLGRRVPGLTPVYFAVTKWLILRRGVADLDYPRARVRMIARSAEVVHLRLRPAAKEPWTVDWIDENLRPGDVLYDIGANVGSYALIAAVAGGPDVQVVAIEPAYANYAALCDNVVLNRVADRVIPLSIVLGEANRLGSMTYRDTSAGAAIHELDGVGDGAYRQPVLVYSLDDVIERFGLPAPTLIKLDVDGAEAAVLEGANRTLARPELRSLVIEVEDKVGDAVLEQTARAGFSLVRRIDARYGEPLPGLWYGIFERVE